MKRNRALARVAISVCALMAIGVPSASASQFNAEALPKSPWILVAGTNTSTVALTTAAGTVTCPKEVMTVQSVFFEPVEKLATATTFSGCSRPIYVEGCYFSYTAGKALEGGGFGGSFAIEYPKGTECHEGPPKSKDVTIEYPTCNATIKPQSGLTTVGYQNVGVGSGRRVVINLSISGIAYTLSGTGITCKGSHTNGSWTTTIELRAADAGGTPTGLFIE